MLITSLLLSAVLLLVANVVARKTGHLAAPCVICGLGAFLGGCVMFPALMLTGVLAALAGLSCGVLGGGPRLFLKCSLATILASHLLVGFLSLHQVQERRRLREEFPSESLAQRLSYEAPRIPSRPSAADGLSTPASKALTDLEDRIDDLSFSRTYSLKRLHEDSVTDFIYSPGFGIGRRPGPRKEYIELPEVESITLPQAAEESPITAA